LPQTLLAGQPGPAANHPIRRNRPPCRHSGVTDCLLWGLSFRGGTSCGQGCSPQDRRSCHWGSSFRYRRRHRQGRTRSATCKCCRDRVPSRAAAPARSRTTKRSPVMRSNQRSPATQPTGGTSSRRGSKTPASAPAVISSAHRSTAARPGHTARSPAGRSAPEEQRTSRRTRGSRLAGRILVLRGRALLTIFARADLATGRGELLAARWSGRSVSSWQ
jgi:hypothetical protein